MTRRAVVIGVRHFPPASLDGEEDGDEDGGYDELPFSHERVDSLAARLAFPAGYVVEKVLDPPHSELYKAVRGCIDDDEVHCRIVHVLSHGRRRHRSRVDAVPTDGILHLSPMSVASWISDAYCSPTPTLFLIDLCFAGEAVDQNWLATDSDQRPVHVIAAASGTAYNGHFTAALSAVVERCFEDGLNTDSSFRYIDMDTFTREVRDETERRSGNRQRVTFTPMARVSDAELPFFANPNYPHDDRMDRVRPAIPTDLLPFIDDPVIGARHFDDRVGRHFTGRTDQLDVIMPWIRGGPGPALRIVTGGPGSGKSALLGAVVCASHPRLHEIDARVRSTEYDHAGVVRAAGYHEPAAVERFASVHARQRRLDDVIAGIGRQLELPVPEEGWSAPELIAAIAAMPSPPTIVLDALDESVEAENLEAVLLLPLVHCLRDTGGRLLVGVRPWREIYRGLFDAAADPDGVVDLDRVNDDVLEQDLKDYVRSILADSPRFSGPGNRVRDRLAQGIAKELAALPRGRYDTGAFLVAGLFARHLGSQPRDTRGPAVSDLLETLPRSLPDVLELDLGAKNNPDTVRTVLATLAMAKGDGMPWHQVNEFLSALHIPVDHPLSPAQDVQFYLRTSLDAAERGTTLYRLFHESLAEYLRKHPYGPPAGETP